HTVVDNVEGVKCVAVSTDGKRIVSGNADGTVRVWNAETGHKMFTITLRPPSHPPARERVSVHSVAFSPDGKRIVSGGRDMMARVWNADTGQLVMILERDPERDWNENLSVAWSPDGKHIVGGRDVPRTIDRRTGPWPVPDVTLRVWD